MSATSPYPPCPKCGRGICICLTQTRGGIVNTTDIKRCLQVFTITAACIVVVARVLLPIALDYMDTHPPELWPCC